MAIRITGMYSGLDTESIINELASAQSYKKNKMVKAQTKLSWKQDAWKALNTKIYSFYSKLDDLRLQSSYLKKKTVVSNPDAIQVTGGSVNASHKVSVEKLSQVAALTSGSLVTDKGVHFTGNATLKQLGFSGTGSIRLSDAVGNYVNIDVDENMKIDDFTKAIENATALKASYDQDNQRIYITSGGPGANANFFLSGNDTKGMEALKALKLLSVSDIDKLTAAGGEYDVWSKYINVDITGSTPSSPTYSSANYTADYLKAIEAETLARLKAMKEQNESLTEDNKAYDAANRDNRKMLSQIKADTTGVYNDYKAYVNNYQDSWTDQQVRDEGKRLYDEIYGKEQKVPVMDNDKVPPEQKKDEDGNLMFETVRTGGMAGQLKTYQETLDKAKEDLQKARTDLDANPGDATLQQKVKDAEAAVTAASKDVSDQQSKMNKAAEIYSFYGAFIENDDKKQANLTTIADNEARFTYTKDADGKETYMEKNAAGKEVAIGQGVTAGEVIAEFDKKVAAAQQQMKEVVRKPDGSIDTDSAWYKSFEGQGTKVDGQDSTIVVDGVTYHSYNDTVTVNGLTITALEETSKAVNVTTKDDTDGIYDMIKDFIKAYSELINEMDSLYNAESAKDYEPLLSEEKEALSDSEVEEWEKKIKDSLLRRDSTLRDVSSAMKMSMMKGINIGGVNFYLSDFGINTLGYFASADNEKNAYHIDGDPDDPKTKSNNDILRAAIDGTPNAAMSDKLRGALAENPNAVMDFFTGLTNGLHDTLAEKMSATKMSSAMTVYNDKKMKEEYDDYTDKIKKQEEKLNAYIDKWYSKFSAMETALAKLESKNSSLSSLFGG